MPNKPMILKGIKFHVETIDRIEALADKENRTFSNMVRCLIVEAFQKREKDGSK